MYLLNFAVFYWLGVWAFIGFGISFYVDEFGCLVVGIIDLIICLFSLMMFGFGVFGFGFTDCFVW